MYMHITYICLAVICKIKGTDIAKVYVAYRVRFIHKFVHYFNRKNFITYMIIKLLYQIDFFKIMILL